MDNLGRTLLWNDAIAAAKQTVLDWHPKCETCDNWTMPGVPLNAARVPCLIMSLAHERMGVQPSDFGCLEHTALLGEEENDH